MGIFSSVIKPVWKLQAEVVVKASDKMSDIALNAGHEHTSMYLDRMVKEIGRNKKCLSECDTFSDWVSFCMSLNQQVKVTNYMHDLQAILESGLKKHQG